MKRRFGSGMKLCARVSTNEGVAFSRRRRRARRGLAAYRGCAGDGNSAQHHRSWAARFGGVRRRSENSTRRRRTVAADAQRSDAAGRPAAVARAGDARRSDATAAVGVEKPRQTRRGAARHGTSRFREPDPHCSNASAIGVRSIARTHRSNVATGRRGHPTRRRPPRRARRRQPAAHSCDSNACAPLRRSASRPSDW